jgi:adenine-specific DNA-methyltransferase
MKPANQTIQTRARELRANQTAAERLLWNHLRNRQVINLKFRRQHPIGQYIADFYCAEAKLIVEIDGDTHFNHGEYDQKRSAWLEEQGLRVIRFTNDQVLNSTDEVLRLIAEACRRTPHLTSSRFHGERD